MFSFELFQVMADTTSNIHEQDGIFIITQPLTESFCNGVEISLHPAALSLTITTHVVVELFHVAVFA